MTRTHAAPAHVTGGMAGKLVMNRKTWFSSTDTVVHSSDGEGPVHVIAWGATLLAWATDAGVRVNLFATDQRVSFIQKPPHSPPSDVCPCHIYWESHDVSVIAALALRSSSLPCLACRAGVCLFVPEHTRAYHSCDVCACCIRGAADAAGGLGGHSARRQVQTPRRNRWQRGA